MHGRLRTVSLIGLILVPAYAPCAAARMQHTTNRLQAGVHLAGYGLYVESEGAVLEEGSAGAKDAVALHFDLGPEDDIGLKVCCDHADLGQASLTRC